MKRARFRFYAELNDLLPPERRFTESTLEFCGEQTVKHLIESLGVPHTEVDLLLVNGEPADFARRLQDGDRASVYPVFEAFDIAALTRVRAEPLRHPRFVLDVHLGRLAAYLRMAGFDSLYRASADDAGLAAVSAVEHRILLTRDRGLLQRKEVTHGYYVRATQPREQLAETLGRFHLARLAAPFTRCLRCNAELREAAKEEVAGRVPPRSLAACGEFRVCTGCGGVYWSGSHHRRMAALLEWAIEHAR